MELCVNDKITANPSADDIRRALDATPHPEDWYLTLGSGDGAMIDALVVAGGSFEVTASDKGRGLKAREPIDAERLSGVLLKLLAGDRSWNAEPFWIEDTLGSTPRPAASAAAASNPPTWALAIVIGSIACVVLAVMFLGGSGNAWRAALPFGDSDFFWVGLIALPMVVLIVVALLAKVIELRRAAA